MKRKSIQKKARKEENRIQDKVRQVEIKKIGYKNKTENVVIKVNMNRSSSWS